MLVATFNSYTAWVGKTITHENGKFVLEGHGRISPKNIMKYDEKGQLEWAGEDMQAWVRMRAYHQAEQSPSRGPSRSTVSAKPKLDATTGDLLLLTVSNSQFALPIEVLEHLRRSAPLVADRLLQSGTRDWGWPSEKLAQIDAEAVIVHEVKCYHGEGHKGWLVATLEQLWWLEKGLFGTAEQPLSYAWDVEVRKNSRLVAGPISGAPLGIKARRGILAVGGELFQMHAGEVDDFAQFLRQMQLALTGLEESKPLPDNVAGGNAAPQPESPAVRLKELAELRDLGIVSEEEFQAKKAELLSKEW